jgi:hypothetical protein
MAEVRRNKTISAALTLILSQRETEVSHTGLKEGRRFTKLAMF